MIKRLLLLMLIATNFLSAQDYNFTTDKQLHFIGGGILGTVGYVTTYDLTDRNRFASYLGGTAAAGLGGLLKEVYDSRSSGTGFNGADLVYTALGGLITSLMSDLIMSKKKNKRRKRKIITH